MIVQKVISGFHPLFGMYDTYTDSESIAALIIDCTLVCITVHAYNGYKPAESYTTTPGVIVYTCACSDATDHIGWTPLRTAKKRGHTEKSLHVIADNSN